MHAYIHIHMHAYIHIHIHTHTHTHTHLLGSYQPHRLVNIPPRLQQHLSRPASTGNMSQGYGRRTTSSPSRSTEAGGRSFFEKTTPSTWQPQQQKSSPADVSGSGSAWKTTPTPEPSGRGMKQMGSPTKQQQQQPKSEAFGRSHRHPSFGRWACYPLPCLISGHPPS